MKGFWENAFFVFLHFMKDIWQGKVALKSAPWLLQMKIRITSHICQMMWSSRWLLWCHSCLELWVITCPHWKVKYLNKVAALEIFWNMKLSKKRKITKGEHKSWRTIGEIKSAHTWFVFKQKPGWSQLQWQEIFQCPSQCNQTVGTDALRLHWEWPSGCGLICGDSSGKQFHFSAVYWK